MGKKRPLYKKVILFVIGVLLIHFALAFLVIANIGLAPYDAIILTVSHLLIVDYGNGCMIAGSVCLIGSLLIYGKKFPIHELLQVVLIFGGGFLLNFLMNDLLANVVLNGLFLRIVVFVAATLVVSFGCLILMQAEFVTTALEFFCSGIAHKFHTTLGVVRWIGDGFFILASLILTLVFKLDWTIGLGTVISLVLFGPSLDILKKPAYGFVKLLHLN